MVEGLWLSDRGEFEGGHRMRKAQRLQPLGFGADYSWAFVDTDATVAVGFAGA